MSKETVKQNAQRIIADKVVKLRVDLNLPINLDSVIELMLEYGAPISDQLEKATKVVVEQSTRISELQHKNDDLEITKLKLESELERIKKELNDSRETITLKSLTINKQDMDIRTMRDAIINDFIKKNSSLYIQQVGRTIRNNG